MGRSSTFYCLTCKVSMYLGYGSAVTWLDDAESVEAYDQRAAQDASAAQLKKNVNMRRALVEHAGHKFVTHSSDWTHVHADGSLCGEFGYGGACVPLIPDYGSWSQLDWDAQ